jgi:hypothetical protein
MCHHQTKEPRLASLHTQVSVRGKRFLHQDSDPEKLWSGLILLSSTRFYGSSNEFCSSFSFESKFTLIKLFSETSCVKWLLLMMLLLVEVSGMSPKRRK